ncbi:MAG: N-acetyl-gamma-glutamyl-phosphate reductase [Desulfuromonadales bacterium]|nr:N-acetyl-gamma-glutamyl-phosphate reductase [Desulfuromonadales bacterium]NIR34029.1 N-acetyl-gamma-glutamyl-phosphate reductase [Desulfuromonadales bacterium]NIS44080.1 N-acetyl-gamma-glutamyl-phosphate reductase [Desulfuromonadales bacterium]
MHKVAVVGASGYTGAELLRILHRHPGVKITCVTSRQYVGEPISKVFPSLRERVDLVCEENDTELIADKADLVFTALPHKTAMEVVPGLLAAGAKVVDLSADYRLRDVGVYEQWYQEHSSASLLDTAVYGLSELYRGQVATARLVANPGCYPTSVILAMAPMIRAGLVDLSTLIVDSKSGASGAGRSAKVGTLYCEVNEGFKAYGVGSHRHTPEIEQELSALAGTPVQLNFTPHLLPVNRGILSTCYFNLASAKNTSQLVEYFEASYAGEPFVRVLPEGELPNVSSVSGSNICDIGVVSDERTGRAIVVSAIDNLVKGAAGQAVQNMNLMIGADEATGLLDVPPFP